MGPDGVWRRIRWGNVARVAGLVALALVVAVWPRLRGAPPRLPPAAPVPLGGAPAAGAGEVAAAGKRPARAEPRRPRGAKGVRVKRPPRGARPPRRHAGRAASPKRPRVVRKRVAAARPPRRARPPPRMPPPPRMQPPRPVHPPVQARL